MEAGATSGGVGVGETRTCITKGETAQGRGDAEGTAAEVWGALSGRDALQGPRGVGPRERLPAEWTVSDARGTLDRAPDASGERAKSGGRPEGRAGERREAEAWQRVTQWRKPHEHPAGKGNPMGAVREDRDGRVAKHQLVTP